MAEPRAVIDIVGAKSLTDEFLKQIGFLVRPLGRSEPGQRAAAMGFGNAGQTGGG